MKRLVLLLTLTGILLVPFEGFAKSPKQTTATVKYKNGDKYVGEITKYPIKYMRLPIPILPIRFVVKNNKIRNGKGVMYYANGDQFDGYWSNNSPTHGTYKYTNGNFFEGEIGKDYVSGKLYHAIKGFVILGNKRWYYPANSYFTGTIKNRILYTGRFDCALTSVAGDFFEGMLFDGQMSSGSIEYANGDTFEGNFISDAPSSGKYRYGGITQITRANHKWEIPAGCVFEGNIVPFTGAVNMEITNAAGDKFVGKLDNGAPDEGTMFFAATGHTETGKWQDGLSPREYQIQQRAKERARDSITKVFVAQQRINDAIRDKRDLKYFEDYMTKHEDISHDGVTESILHGASIKLAQLYTGKKVIYKNDIYVCKKIEFLGKNLVKFTISPQNKQDKILYLKRLSYYKYPPQNDYKYPEKLTYRYYNCAVVENIESTYWMSNDLYLASDIETAKNRAKNYYIGQYGNKYGIAVLNRKIDLGMTVEMVQEIKGKGNISQYVSEGRKITILSYGGVESNLFATIVAPVNTYTFVNGRLTEYSTNEGQRTVIWN